MNSKNFLTGAINYGYDITPAWRVLAGYSNGFAAPSFNQLYYPPYCYGGYCFDSSNPNLKTEKANYAQLGVQWAQAHYGARVTYFDTRYRDKIANDANYIPQYIARARAKGVVPVNMRVSSPTAPLDVLLPKPEGPVSPAPPLTLDAVPGVRLTSA